MTRLLVLVAVLAIPAIQRMPPIGIIDFYGLGHLSPQQVRDALPIKEGTAFPSTDAEAEKMIEAAKARLRALPGVKDVHGEVVCCDAGRSMLYVGIVEEGARTMRFNAPPKGTVRLGDEVMKATESYGEALMAAVQKGEAGEDDSQGHSLSENTAARTIEERFITFARRDEARLRDVLAHSSDAGHRAAAAQVLGYAADKKGVVAILSTAMADPDENVRNNAMRALAVIAGFAASHPELGIRVSPEPFVDLLNSPVWTDLNKASFALAQLTAARDPKLLAALRRRALPALVEMARWKSRGHAGAAFFILGRVAGMGEDAIKQAWDRDDREAVVAAATRRAVDRRQRVMKAPESLASGPPDALALGVPSPQGSVRDFRRLNRARRRGPVGDVQQPSLLAAHDPLRVERVTGERERRRPRGRQSSLLCAARSRDRALPAARGPERPHPPAPAAGPWSRASRPIALRRRQQH